MSEPPTSLHERLREAAISHGHALYKRDGGERRHIYYGIKDDALTAIQKHIEDAVTAPLRDEVADLGSKVIALRREADDKHAENVALKARADALRESASNFRGDVLFYLSGNRKDIPTSEFDADLAAYDAADRAGEAPEKTLYSLVDEEEAISNPDAFSFAPSPTGVETQVKSDQTVDILLDVQRSIRQAGSAPSPTDAVKTSDLYNIVTDPNVPEGDVHFRDGDKTLGKIVGIGEDRAGEETPMPSGETNIDVDIDVRVTGDQNWEVASNVDGTIILNGVEHELIAGSTNKINGLRVLPRDLSAPSPTDADDALRLDSERIAARVTRADSLGDVFADVDAVDDRFAALEQRIVALEAARTPVPVVTDEMVDAFWSVYEPDEGRDCRAGIAAALKAAGGAK